VRGTGDQLVEELKWPTVHQLVCAYRVALFWAYANGTRRTPGGSDVIQETTSKPRSARLRAREEECTPDHTVVGVPIFNPRRAYNSPLAAAVHLYNMSPDLVTSDVRTTKRVKALHVANARGRLVIARTSQLEDSLIYAN